jgi:hypothetical protein
VDTRHADRRAVTLTGPVALVGGGEHPYAASRLRAGLEPVECLPAAGTGPPATRATLRLRLDPGMPEGAYRIEVDETSDGIAIDLIGGPFSGVIQAVEALLRVAESEHDVVRVPTGRTHGDPSLAYRTFWTWDHSTHWDVDSFGLQETGAFNPYGKQPDAFVSDYRRMIDFMSLHGIGGVVIYGLLRDSHGGVEGANEVCRYARERGVRVLAGFAVNSYGGVYYEGRHRYNLATWLRQHPELLVDTSSLPGFTIDDYGLLGFPHGDYTLASRSDRPEMERWHLDGLDWLLDSVDIDGINFEFGDYAGNDAHEDMRRLLPGLLDRARTNRDDLWLIAELGWDFLVEQDAAQRIAGLPAGCAYQFTYNRSYWSTLRSKLTPEVVAGLPTGTKLIRPHAGSQWNRQRYALMAAHYMELAQVAIRSGLDGATVFGEVSDYSPPNELNYLAFARFSIEADLTWERFMDETVAPRLGGADAADRFISLLERLDGDLLDAAGLQPARDEVRDIAASLRDPARGRWAWLEERLSRRIHSRLGR